MPWAPRFPCRLLVTRRWKGVCLSEARIPLPITRAESRPPPSRLCPGGKHSPPRSWHHAGKTQDTAYLFSFCWHHFLWEMREAVPSSHQGSPTVNNNCFKPLLPLDADPSSSQQAASAGGPMASLYLMKEVSGRV